MQVYLPLPLRPQVSAQVLLPILVKCDRHPAERIILLRCFHGIAGFGGANQIILLRCTNSYADLVNVLGVKDQCNLANARGSP